MLSVTDSPWQQSTICVRICVDVGLVSQSNVVIIAECPAQCEAMSNSP